MGGPTSDQDEDVTTKCAVCKNIAQSRCGGCQKVGYCTREHQKQHWRSHKSECCAWKISESPELGRYLEAIRDIKPGEIIIQEKPLLISPMKNTPPVCLGCYSEFKPDGVETDDGTGVKPRECRNGCGWPMCLSDSCMNSKVHEAECKISKARGKVVIRTLDTEHPLYQSIGILRALGLKDTNSEAFDKLMSLESNTEKRKAYKDALKDQEDQEQLAGSSSSNPHGIKGPHDMGPDVTTKIIRSFFQRTDVSEDWILKLIGIIETNGHEIPIPDSNTGHINRRIIGVYHNSSMIEHNCKANACKSWDVKTKSIIIRSSETIRKGSHISISYVDPLWGTNDRVNLLQMTKFFQCRCERCKDPTELGCHISSLKCQHPKCTNVPKTGYEKGVLSNQGMIVPENPFRPEMDWKCLSCGEDYSVNYISSLIHKAGQEMEELNEKIGDISAKEDFLKRFLKTLSPNHFFLLEVKVELAQLYGRTSEEPLQHLAPKKLLRKIQLCEELLTVLSIISPGYNRLRALILYELQAGVFTLSRLRRSVEEISMEHHLNELMQCGKWMTEVIKVLGWESENSIERKRAAGAERDLELLRSAVLSLQASSGLGLGGGGGHSHEDSSSSSSSSSRKKNNDAKGDGKDDEGDAEEVLRRSHLSADQESFIEEVF